MIKIPEREYRAFGNFKLDEKEDDKKIFIRGIPIVYDTPTCLFEMDGVKYFEVIERGALDGADTSDFIFNKNHELSPYARNKNGTLKWRDNATEVEMEAILNAEDQRHRELAYDIKTGLIDKMSFSFSIREASYDRETRTRHIRKIKKLYDFSAVTFPAYEQTSISARGFFEEEHRKEFQLLEQKRARDILILRTYI